MSRWTLEEWLGWRKIQEDWNEPWPWWTPGKIAFRNGWGLFKDGSAHVLLGVFIAAYPAIVTDQWWIPALVSLICGAAREIWQYLSDSTPHPNLIDRIKDSFEFGLGGLLVGIIL